jgi:hypothetical protein
MRLAGPMLCVKDRDRIAAFCRDVLSGGIVAANPEGNVFPVSPAES